MIPVENEKNLPKYLIKHAREFCATINAIEIYNIAILGEGDYRIMYWIMDGDKRKMEAIILKMPTDKE
jgi:hypothetical protein